MQIVFGTAHPLKTEYLRGHLPTVKVGLYGGILTPDTVTIEHLVPKVQHGRTTYSNLVLATKENNNRRGSLPLKRFVTEEQVQTYLNQFKGVITDTGFVGDCYIRRVEPTLKSLLK